MDLNIATSFLWLILLAFFARPVCMQIFWDATNVCNNRSPLCYESDPMEDLWDVELHCSADRVRVVYTNYNDEYRVVERFEEIRLHCTAPGGTAQVDVMPASVNCSGTSTGGDWRNLGFEWHTLNASGIQPGWTCTVSGCFELSVSATGMTEYVRTPSTDFVLTSKSCYTGPVTTAPPTTTETMRTTTDAENTTTSSTTDANDTTTSSTTEMSTTSNATTTDTGDTEEKQGLVKEMYTVTVITLPLIAVLLVALCAITLIVFAVFTRRKLRRDRKRTILIFDEKNMVFDPEYVPAVSIEKPLSHRFSVVSNDFLQFLTPLNNGGLHGGNDNMAILLEGSCDGSDDVLLQVHDNTSHVKATDAKNLPQEFSGSGTTQAEDPPPDYSSVCHSELTTCHGEVSGYVVESNRQSDVSLDGHSVTLHETNWSETIDMQSRDSSSLLLSENNPSENVEAGNTNLDKHYNSSSGGYMDSNMSPVAIDSKHTDSQLSNGNTEGLFELEIESDGSDEKPPFLNRVLNSADTTSYVDSALFVAQNTHDKTFVDLNLDSSYLHSEDSGVSTHSSPSSPLSSLHEHTTDVDGYVSDGQTPSTDRRCSSKQDECLELDFVTESDSYSTEEDKDEQCLVSLTFQEHSQSPASFKDLQTPPKDIDLKHSSSPSDSAHSQGYITCDDITSATSEPLMTKMLVTNNLTSSSENNREFPVHLDFNCETDMSRDPVLLTGSGMKINTDLPNFENSVHEYENYLLVPVTGDKHLPDVDLPPHDGGTGQYIVYDFRPMRHLLSDNSGTDCLSAIVPEGQNLDVVKLQPLLAYYPSDTSSGYVSGSLN